MPIHASKQFHPDRQWQRHADGTFKLNAQGRRITRGHRSAPRKHRGEGAAPRPPEGTVLPLTGMVVGPEPTGSTADLARPLRTRRPQLFDGSWRTPQQRVRAEKSR